MSSPAQSRGARKGIRDAFQAVLAVIAAGGATAVIELIVDHLNPVYGVLMAFVFKIVITWAQNYLETAGKIPVLLPTPGLVSAVLDPVKGAVTDATPLVAPAAAATVDAVSDAAGKVTGEVIDTSGGIVGKVTGLLRRKGERGGVPLALIIAVVLVLVLLGGFGLCGDALFEDEDERNDLGLVRVELVSHEYDDGGYYEDGDEGYGGGQNYEDQWSNEDRNRNRNRNRGAFSPGPFRDSPVTICLPYSCNSGGEQSGDNRGGDEPPPDEGEQRV